MLESKPARSEMLKCNQLIDLPFWQATKQKKHLSACSKLKPPPSKISRSFPTTSCVTILIFWVLHTFWQAILFVHNWKAVFGVFFCIWQNAPSILPFISGVLQGLLHTSQNVLPKLRQCYLGLVLLLYSYPNSSLWEPTFQSFPRLPSLPICRSCHIQSKHSTQEELLRLLRAFYLNGTSSCGRST